MAKAIKRNLFFIPGDASLVKSSGYVGDLVRSILFMLIKNEGMTVYNFCFPREITIREIANNMADIAKWKRPQVLPLRFLVPVLKKLGKPMSHIGNRVEKLLTPTRVLPHKLIEANFEWKYNLESSLKEWYELSNFDLKS
jgi:NAD dependent epimerase/dehydratase family enzyme